MQLVQGGQIGLGVGHHGTPRTIDNFVLQLRNKIEEDPALPKRILTVRGVGYRFGSEEE